MSQCFWKSRAMLEAEGHCECAVCRDDAVRLLVNAAEEGLKKGQKIEYSG